MATKRQVQKRGSVDDREARLLVVAEMLADDKAAYDVVKTISKSHRISYRMAWVDVAEVRERWARADGGGLELLRWREILDAKLKEIGDKALKAKSWKAAVSAAVARAKLRGVISSGSAINVGVNVSNSQVGGVNAAPSPSELSPIERRAEIDRLLERRQAALGGSKKIIEAKSVATKPKRRRVVVKRSPRKAAQPKA